MRGLSVPGAYDWAEGIGQRVTRSGQQAAPDARTERLDRLLTHPVMGVVAFMTVMFLVFVMIFWIAQYPMDAIEWLFNDLGSYVAQGTAYLASWLPAGTLHDLVADDLNSLLVEGVIGGVGGVLVFLPQIGILFFFLSLLEDTGYMARAAFVMDRLMRRVGLPGKAFVPMLSAHACAVPAIMSTRSIEDKRDRLVSMLVLPLLSCSAHPGVHDDRGAAVPASAIDGGGAVHRGVRIGGGRGAVDGVHVQADDPAGRDAATGAGAADVQAAVAGQCGAHDVRSGNGVRAQGGHGDPDRVGDALGVAHYPKSSPPAEAVAFQQQAQQAREAGQPDRADDLLGRADRLTAQHNLDHSFAGMVGHGIEPVFQPLGYDWQMDIGILSSFAAREVFVSTLSVVYGVGADAADAQPQHLYDTLRSAHRAGSSVPVFGAATCVSLLIFYVLAMQCISTTAIMRRETGGWKWPLFQFAYMSVLAYVGALIAFQTLQWL